MKNGLWIGGLVLALLARGSDLLAEDVQWRAVNNPPGATTDVALDQPSALKIQPVKIAESLAPASGDIVPVGYRVPQAPAARPARPAPEIIAVSAPVSFPESVPAAIDEESTETEFAVERPLRPIAAARPPVGAIKRTGASVPVPVPVPSADPGPGWNSNWSAAPLGGPALGEVDPPAPGIPGFAGPQQRQRFYVSGEYLLWFLQGDKIPPLASTSAPNDFGILGAPTTTVLFGGNAINTGVFSGARFMGGIWLDDCATKAIEFGGFFVGPQSTNFSVNSFTNPVIGRPFFDVNHGQESAQLTALPGLGTGTLTIHAPTNLWGLESNLRCLLCCGCNYRITALAGFRNINLDENITMVENIQGDPTAPAPFTDARITVLDRFSTQNHFYGGQVGADARLYYGRWFIDTRAKVALGATAQQLNIDGGQQLVSPSGAAQSFTGGLLALPSNIGRHHNSVFSVVPEVWLNVGYQFTPNLRGFVGYNFLYWSNVIRPGTSIDRNLDVTQIPNFTVSPGTQPASGTHPAATFHQVGFWAQGINFGLEFVY
jgi:hypothetical protein